MTSNNVQLNRTTLMTLDLLVSLSKYDFEGNNIVQNRQPLNMIVNLEGRLCDSHYLNMSKSNWINQSNIEEI